MKIKCQSFYYNLPFLAKIKLTDPAEKEIHNAGFVKVREAESSSIGITKKRNKISDFKFVSEELKRSGIDFLELPTEERISHKLRQFFKSRNLLSRGTR